MCDENARKVLRQSIQKCFDARPFILEAIVLLPDHLHMIWTLPEGDDDFSGRIASIKASFSHQWISSGGLESARSPSRQRRRGRRVWQPRFWEHWIRDETGPGSPPRLRSLQPRQTRAGDVPERLAAFFVSEMGGTQRVRGGLEMRMRRAQRRAARFQQFR